MGTFFGLVPPFVDTDGFFRALRTDLGLDSASDSPTAVKRDRFGEGGGRLHTGY